MKYAWPVLFLSFLAASAAAESASPAEVKTVLRVGVTECYRDRLPLDDFLLRHDDVVVKEVTWGRNPFNVHKNDALPRRHLDLPDVISLFVARGSDDLEQLADRGLIEPLDEHLEALGLSSADFAPKAREAVSYKGRIWALPHHVVTLSLTYDRAVFKALGQEPVFGSWEALFEAGEGIAAQQRDGQPMVGFSVPLGDLALAEVMALSAGEAAVDLSEPEFFRSQRMQDALELIKRFRARGAIASRPVNSPLRREKIAALGLEYVETVYPTHDYGVIAMPTKLRRADAPAVSSSVPGNLECFAVRSNSLESREVVRRFLAWLVSSETDWAVFDLSNQKVSTRKWVFDTVHVPMRPATLESVDFEYALKKFPDYGPVVEACRRAVFPRNPPALEVAVHAYAERVINARIDEPDLGRVLEDLYEAVVEKITSTPVESLVYDEY